MSEAKNIIYALHHASSSHVYVGKTTKGLKRPRQHLMLSKYHPRWPVSRWVVKLQERGLTPEITVLEECAGVLLDEAERFYIASFRAIGMTLLNVTDGGDGAPGYKHTEEQRRKFSAIHKGKKLSPETKAKISRGRTGIKLSVAERQKMSLRRKGKPLSALANARSRAAVTGSKRSPEAKSRMTEAAKKRWQNPEYRARQIASQTRAYNDDRRHTASLRQKKRLSDPDTRMRQGQAIKDGWARKKQNLAEYDEYRKQKSIEVRERIRTKGLSYLQKTVAAAKEKWKDPVWRENRLEQMRGKKRSDETRAKMRQAWVRRREREGQLA